MAGFNADPVAGVTYASSRGAREKTGLNAVNDFTKNATADYAQMLADKAAQTEANALPLGGSGIGKLNEAIENSPQLQSGLMAAGLSLMFGGDVESAITTGLGAASNYNQQVTAEEDKKKAEMLAGAKQQSQMEHSYEQGNLMQRQPDSFNVDAARISAGVNNQQLSADLIKHISDQANENKRLRMQLGLPELPLPIEVASVSGTIGELSRQSDLVLPGMKPGQLNGTTKRIALSGDQKTLFRAIREQAKAAGFSPAQRDALLRQEIDKRGLGLAIPDMTAFHAELDNFADPVAKPAPASEPVPGKPTPAVKKPTLAPPPSLASSRAVASTTNTSGRGAVAPPTPGGAKGQAELLTFKTKKQLEAEQSARKPRH